ncbi:hypothetical protein [Pseudobythopirellula maris]|nr:hypothetical protein [Pseudobythopirellula maris]
MSNTGRNLMHAMERNNVGLALLLAAMATAGGASSADASDIVGLGAELPEASFDIPRTLVCRDVTTEEFAATRPGERLLKVEAPISLVLYHGEARRVEDLVIEIDGEAAGLMVHDYGPKTLLESEHAEPIEVERTSQQDKSMGASLGGKLGVDVAITPTIHGAVGRSQKEVEKLSRLPPKEPTVVSGTVNSRRGVYFKLKRSSQSTLEGERNYTVTFVAPVGWTGGEVRVECLARGTRKWLLVERREVWAEKSSPVELRLVSHTAESLE